MALFTVDMTLTDCAFSDNTLDGTMTADFFIVDQRDRLAWYIPQHGLRRRSFDWNTRARRLSSLRQTNEKGEETHRMNE
jgi:hypothetical protein